MRRTVRATNFSAKVLFLALAVLATYARATQLSFSPRSGAVGTIITVTGEDFTHSPSVRVGGVAAVRLRASTTSLTALVMPGSVTGPVKVVTKSGTALSKGNFVVSATGVPSFQQGNKLLGSGGVGLVGLGGAVAVSADGNTALIGGAADNNQAGAVWVFTRSKGIWKQQGKKLVGSGAVGSAEQGGAVALSADGNTALVGGGGDNDWQGAVWVFTRTNGAWKQQGSKLVGTGAIGYPAQGGSVALSADGNTALIGGPQDFGYFGATWVFVRSNGVWKQQGNKLVGSGASPVCSQGSSVALSANGNTALIGAPNDNGLVGSAWVFTRSNGIWTQQGSKFSGDNPGGQSHQGTAVALSADGNTAILGGGTSWVFTRSKGSWTQQGDKLVGNGEAGSSDQGFSVALSADGDTALLGGPLDNNYAGATWVFTRTISTWTQQGSKLFGTGANGAANQGFRVALSGDGSTALVGGPFDNNYTGAAWVFIP